MNLTSVGSVYQDHLANLYPETVIDLHQSAASASATEQHRIFDVIRRFLDMCRILNKSWPTTTQFMTSCQGDEVLERIFSGIMAHTEYPDLKSAIRQASIDILANQVDPVFLEVFTYEECRSKPGKTICIYDTGMQPHGYNLVLTCQNDILNLFTSLEFYQKTYAPASFFRALQIPKRLTYVLKET